MIGFQLPSVQIESSLGLRLSSGSAGLAHWNADGGIAGVSAPRGRGPGQLAMRRIATRPDRAPVTGPAAWFIRFVGVDGVIGPLGFGGFTIPAIISVAQGRGILYVWGNPTYGDGPFERIGVSTTVPLLVGFLAACLVQVVGAGLLIWLRPSGFIVMPGGMLLSAIFWWGFDLPLAWLGAGPD